MIRFLNYKLTAGNVIRKIVPVLLAPPLALLIASICSCSADTPPRYQLTVLPLSFYGYNDVDDAAFQGGINAQGQVVGSFPVRSGSLVDSRIALWQKGRPVRILDKRPVTREDTEDNRDLLYPTAINARGETTGVETISSSGAYTIQESISYLFWNGRLNLLSRFPTHGAGDTNSIAFGLNDHGDIVGSFIYSNNFNQSQDDLYVHPHLYDPYAFLRRNGRIIGLWTGYARGINNQGWIVGITNGGIHKMNARGVLWRSGHLTLFKMQPAAISGSGEIAGNIPVTEDDSKACVWQQGQVTRLSKQMSHAYALNNRQQVVGELGSEAKPFPTHAVLWQDGRTYNLNRCVPLPKGWVLEKAIGINDHGWIIGEGSVYKTPKDKQAVKTFTFLLTPRGR